MLILFSIHLVKFLSPQEGIQLDIMNIVITEFSVSLTIEKKLLVFYSAFCQHGQRNIGSL